MCVIIVIIIIVFITISTIYSGNDNDNVDKSINKEDIVLVRLHYGDETTNL